MSELVEANMKRVAIYMLMLRRAPLFLRVTSLHDHWDALDQPKDTPALEETLYAYQRVGTAGNCHLRFGGTDRHLSGFYVMANYRLVSDQPTDAQMRDKESWRSWCYQARENNMKSTR